MDVVFGLGSFINSSMTTPTRVRKGQAPAVLSRSVFHTRFMESFMDPAFQPEAEALARLESVAWEAYKEGRKAPVTQPAGKGYADPKYDLSVEWAETKRKIEAAQAFQKKKSTPSRILLICGSARNDGTCPGEISKSWRLMNAAKTTLVKAGMQVDVLDLSLLTSSYHLNIHPCKACVSTAMPLCHWPCSCYPNHAQGQTSDWMAEIYERWAAAHGVIIVTPVYWYQSPSPLKLMIDRLVCADGGNPDPTTTHGKDPAAAKALELKGWDYPKHLDGRAYGVVVHGDVAGIEGARRALCDWLEWMGLIDSGVQAKLDRFIGYYEPYATSHDALDKDKAVQAEVRNVAGAVANAVKALRVDSLSQPDKDMVKPRPK